MKTQRLKVSTPIDGDSAGRLVTSTNSARKRTASVTTVVCRNRRMAAIVRPAAALRNTPSISPGRA